MNILISIGEYIEIIIMKNSIDKTNSVYPF